jgi:lipoprotein-releasing system ATP-binding protein
MSDLLVAKGLVKSYREGGETLVVLDDLDLSVRQGETLAIIGPSGVGKSTLLHLLGLLDTPTRGGVTYRGASIGSASGRARARIRNSEFGFIFQFYHLLPDLTALDNVLLPLMVQSNWLAWQGRRAAGRDRAETLLNEVSLADRSSHKPGELSGGEKQRVAIARALINEPDIVFCDEPTGNLDERTSTQIHDLLWTINAKMGTTFVIVTHDEELAGRCTRIARMHEGKISEITENRK